ncbi:MAG: ribose 5-phosphate isomerase B [Elusimicrobia bacterium RIFCSPLOWO2_02_FULL_61_11]|nr:MAG: ribose 5-phosphate isomerase B [Elusimicrobia bacterium RIFCSPLOWO2_02_FULL_61_11]
MKLAIASDHAGYPLKTALIPLLRNLGYEISDQGTDSAEKAVDYPDFAAKASREVLAGRADKAIIVCGSGVGACIAANKLEGIRAGLCHDTYSAHQGVEHDDMNVLCLGARIIGEALAFEIAAAFTAAKFSGEDRHKRRLKKIDDLEKGF